jgi:Na+-driven multidrug efflux pump
MHATSPAFPGAWIGSIAGAAVAAVLGWWWFRALRRARAQLPPAVSAVVAA